MQRREFLLAGAAMAAAKLHGQRATPSGLGICFRTDPERLARMLPQARARALIALRKQRGGLKSLGELRDVKGIGEAGLERLRPFVRFEGKTTAQLH